jgi:hypothetical protein
MTETGWVTGDSRLHGAGFVALFSHRYRSRRRTMKDVATIYNYRTLGAA